MSKTDMAVCTICGRNYKTCLSCKNLNITKPWRSITDTVECYKIFLAVSQYNNGYISKDEAKRQLEEISFNIEDLKESVQAKIAEIMSVPESAKKIVSKSSADKSVNSN